MSKEARTELPVRSFAEAAFEKWLQTNHTHSQAVVAVFQRVSDQKALAHKARSTSRSVTVGSTGNKKFDDSSYLHKFTPRG